MSFFSDYRRLKKCISQIKESKSPSIRPSDSPNSFRRPAQSTSNNRTPTGPRLSPNVQSQGWPSASPFSLTSSRYEGDRLSDRPQPAYGSSGRTPPLRTHVREPSPPLEQLPPPMQDLPKPMKGSDSLTGSHSLVSPSVFQVMFQCFGVWILTICTLYCYRYKKRPNAGLERHQSSPTFRTSPRAFPLGALRRSASTRTGSFSTASPF